MDRAKVKELFNQLYENVDGRALSLKSRENDEFKSKSFVYGEVVPDSFYEVIAEVNPLPGQVFYDLGSGTGKAVFLAHWLFDFSRTTGIELLDSLYQASAEALERYEKTMKSQIADEANRSKIEFIHGDILEADFKDADIIFINSTCFQDDLMEALEPKLEVIRPHAHVISLSKPLKSPAFHQYKHQLYEFSWGQATAFFHRKRLWKLYM